MDICQQFATQVHLPECMSSQLDQTLLNFITVFMLLSVHMLLKQELEKNNFELYQPLRRELRDNKAHIALSIHQTITFYETRCYTDASKMKMKKTERKKCLKCSWINTQHQDFLKLGASEFKGRGKEKDDRCQIYFYSFYIFYSVVFVKKANSYYYYLQ